MRYLDERSESPKCTKNVYNTFAGLSMGIKANVLSLKTAKFSNGQTWRWVCWQYTARNELICQLESLNVLSFEKSEEQLSHLPTDNSKITRCIRWGLLTFNNVQDKPKMKMQRLIFDFTSERVTSPLEGNRLSIISEKRNESVDFLGCVACATTVIYGHSAEYSITK